MLLSISTGTGRMDQFSPEEINSYFSSSIDIPDGVISMDELSTEQIDHFLSTSGNWTQYDWDILRTAVPDRPSPYMLDASLGYVHDFMEDVVEHAAEPGPVQSSSSQSISAGHTQTSQQQNSIHSNNPSMAVRTRRRYNVSEWEEKRDLIRTLYIDQEKSLKAMRQILRDEHGFDASYVYFML